MTIRSHLVKSMGQWGLTLNASYTSRWPKTLQRCCQRFWWETLLGLTQGAVKHIQKKNKVRVEG